MNFLSRMALGLMLLLMTFSTARASEFQIGEIVDIQDDVYVIEMGGEQLRVEKPEGFLTTQSQEGEVGEKMVMGTFETGAGLAWTIYDTYRSSNLLLLLGGFFVLVFLIAGKRGFTSLLGLVISISIIIFAIIPLIVSGASPLLTALGGSCVIGGVTIFIAHGFSRKSLLAFYATIFTLLCAAGFAMAAVMFAKVFGTGSEESVYFLGGEYAFLDLRGILLGGVLLGALGVLDDITVSQVFSIAEIQRANPKLSAQELFQRGMRVGREHIASMVNTLALAYVGVALPLILLISLDASTPLWVTLNSEFVGEEVVRVVVGSSALTLAAPIASFLAAYFLKKKTYSEGEVT